MKKTKHRRPKSHGKSKKRAIRPAASEGPSISLSAAREKIKNYLVEKQPEHSDLIVEMLSTISDEQLAKVAAAANQIYEPKRNWELDDFEEDDEPDFDLFLELCRSEEAYDRDAAKSMERPLSLHLKDLKTRSEIGDSSLNDQIADVQESLAEAIADKTFPSYGLLAVDKVLADASWEVPAALRQALLETIKTRDGEDPGGEAFQGKLIAAMVEASEESSDEFALYEHLASLLEAFPPELAALSVARIAGENAPMVRALVGFALHRETVIAAAALEALARDAQAVEGLVVDRLARIRPWIIPDRQALVDSAIEALRPGAKPSPKPEWRKIEKTYATSCDATGSQSLLAQIRESESFKTAGVLVGARGILEADTFGARTRREAVKNLESLKAKTEVVEADTSTLGRLLSLALADGLAEGRSPMYRLVQFAEQVGIEPIAPVSATAAEIAEELLAGLPAHETDDDALARAHREVAEAQFSAKWVVVSRPLHDLLKAGATKQEGVEMLLATHIADQKASWARTCAMSALALRGTGRQPSRNAVALALVARDLASDKPAEALPLLRDIAEKTVEIMLLSMDDD